MGHVLGKITGIVLGLKIVAWLLITATGLIFSRATPKTSQDFAQSDDCPYEAKDGKSEDILAIRYG